MGTELSGTRIVFFLLDRNCMNNTQIGEAIIAKLASVELRFLAKSIEFTIE